MIIPLFCLALLTLYFVVELIKIKWLRHATHIILLLGSIVFVFKIGFDVGNTTARGYASREVQDVIDIVLDSSKTNTVAELRAKLEIMKTETPKAIMENDRMPLLRALNIIN